MKIRIVSFLAAAFLVSACTDQDWNQALTFVGLSGSKDNGSQTTPTARSAPAQTRAADAAPQSNAFCDSVASQDAQGNDFDLPTQQRVFVQSYRQCVAVFGDITK